MSIEKALGKLRAAQMCHPNAVQALIDEAIAAIQQAEAQQPATGEPVACATPDGLKSNWHAHHAIVNKAALQMVRNALRNDVERGLKVRGEMLAELDSATFQAHPAQDVPDDVVRDAAQEAVEELHKLNEYAIVCINDPEWTRVSDTCQKLIGSIDAAMLLAAAPHPQQPKELS